MRIPERLGALIDALLVPGPPFFHPVVPLVGEHRNTEAKTGSEVINALFDFGNPG